MKSVYSFSCKIWSTVCSRFVNDSDDMYLLEKIKLMVVDKVCDGFYLATVLLSPPEEVTYLYYF